MQQDTACALIIGCKDENAKATQQRIEPRKRKLSKEYSGDVLRT